MPQQVFPLPYMFIAVRAKTDLAALSAAVRREVQTIDPSQPVSNVKTMAQLMSESVSAHHLAMTMFELFAILALLLVGVGIYGVMAYTVTQRTQEIGLRMALGARAGDVLRLVMRQGMKLTLTGVTVGVASALWVTRLMKNLLFEVSATDPVTFVLVALLITFVALLACYVPARRATKVDPMIALRHE